MTAKIPLPGPHEKWNEGVGTAIETMDAGDGFDAFGKPVSTERQVAALDCAVEVMGVDAAVADPIIRNAAVYVEKDEPASALMVLMNIVDLTGAYRLLAVMCTD